MEYQKTAEATINLIGNKIADMVAKLHNGRIMMFQKICNNIILKQLKMRMIKKIPKERYISAEEIQKTIDNLRLI